MKKFKLLTHAEFLAFPPYERLPSGSCFISVDGDTGDRQLCIPLGTKLGEQAEKRAEALIHIINIALEVSK